MAWRRTGGVGQGRGGGRAGGWCAARAVRRAAAQAPLSQVRGHLGGERQHLSFAADMAVRRSEVRPIKSRIDGGATKVVARRAKFAQSSSRPPRRSRSGPAWVAHAIVSSFAIARLPRSCEGEVHRSFLDGEPVQSPPTGARRVAPNQVSSSVAIDNRDRWTHLQVRGGRQTALTAVDGRLGRPPYWCRSKARVRPAPVGAASEATSACGCAPGTCDDASSVRSSYAASGAVVSRIDERHAGKQPSHLPRGHVLRPARPRAPSGRGFGSRDAFVRHARPRHSYRAQDQPGDRSTRQGVGRPLAWARSHRPARSSECPRVCTDEWSQTWRSGHRARSLCVHLLVGRLLCRGRLSRAPRANAGNP